MTTNNTDLEGKKKQKRICRMCTCHPHFIAGYPEEKQVFHCHQCKPEQWDMKPNNTNLEAKKEQLDVRVARIKIYKNNKLQATVNIQDGMIVVTGAVKGIQTEVESSSIPMYERYKVTDYKLIKTP